MKKRLIDGRMLVLILSQLLMGVVVIVFVVGNSNSKHEKEFWRTTGNKLQAAGVTKEAAASYENYLQTEELSPAERAKIAYTLGGLYEEEGAYERALAWYYMVEASDPKSEYLGDAGKRIVALLERLKKFSAAKYELAQKTSLNKNEKKTGGVVIAEVEGKPIYLHQINEEFDQLPEGLKKQFKGQQGKQGYAQKYIADELFLIKAKRLQYDQDAEVRRQLQQVERQLLVQRVLREELKDEVKVEQTDLENYFKANADKYKKDKKVPKLAEVKKQVELDYRMEKTQKVYQRLVGEILQTEDVKLYLDRIK